MPGDMTTLRQGSLTLAVDRRGAVITRFTWTGKDGATHPLMRGTHSYAGDPRTAACFPLLPFGNRVAGNSFTVEARRYDLSPNQPWDRHYLHGDGWLGTWDIEHTTKSTVELAFTHDAAPGQPYAYEARILYALTPEAALAVRMEIRNRGSAPLPFGLGLHPYLPLTPQTTLVAPAQAFFSEEAEFLPGARGRLPPDLDFAVPRPLPRRWVNNGFAGWDGAARVAWPEAGLALHITADRAFRDYFLFLSDTRFEPGFAGDYFCFEPMTHQANGQHAADFGGLALLAPGAALHGSVLFTPEEVTP